MPDITCASCGASMTAETKFCINCGAKNTATPEPVLTGAAFTTATSQQQPQTQYQQQPYTAPVPTPSASAPPSTPVSVPEAKPMGFGGYFLTLLIFEVPIAGVIMAFVWAFGKKTGKNRKNFAKAQLIVWGIFFAGALVFYFLNFSALNELVRVILS